RAEDEISRRLHGLSGLCKSGDGGDDERLDGVPDAARAGSQSARHADENASQPAGCNGGRCRAGRTAGRRPVGLASSPGPRGAEPRLAACDASKEWRSLGESNPRSSLERAVSWAARRRELGCPREARAGMIPAFLAGRNHGSLLNDTELESRHGHVIVPRSEHNISRANISPNALKVLYRLKSAGFEAFLVGGGVRDLLLDRHPKDFDVVTNADPDQIQNLFRNCRLIGRRFRLAHVRFGRDIVEVATFRAANVVDPDDDDRAHSDSGRILRDNVYGTIDEDVWRRDFTVNALYYNITDFSIWDYVNGVGDVRARTLRLIGDPEKRYREDPVRMLRAVRFAAKLDFTLAPETEAPIASLGGLLKDVPPARLFDELLKLFQSGHAVQSFELLLRYDLLRYLFRDTQVELETPDRD